MRAEETGSRIANRAGWAWAVIAATVVGYDTYALLRGDTTLSAWFWRTKTRRWFRLLVPAAWVGLSWHLLIGDRRFLVGRSGDLYRKVHPLYVLHDRLILFTDERDGKKSL